MRLLAGVCIVKHVEAIHIHNDGPAALARAVAVVDSLCGPISLVQCLRIHANLNGRDFEQEDVPAGSVLEFRRELWGARDRPDVACA